MSQTNGIVCAIVVEPNAERLGLSPRQPSIAPTQQRPSTPEPTPPQQPSSQQPNTK